MSDLDRYIETLRKCEIITEAEVKNLCNKAREILVEESNVQRVDAPVTVRALACAGGIGDPASFAGFHLSTVNAATFITFLFPQK